MCVCVIEFICLFKFIPSIVDLTGSHDNANVDDAITEVQTIIRSVTKLYDVRHVIDFTME